ncbi:MAG: hypothetical protein HN435_00520 [Nitrospinaceae bacterium]|nr:hypothetical protein [Nitrospinaceae bacterium]
MTLSGLVVGGFMYVLIAQVRGIRSMDPRWEQFARTFSTYIFRIAVLGVGMSGCLLWLVFVSVHPAVAAELLRIFEIPAYAAWLLLLISAVSLFTYINTWSRWRNNILLHLLAGSIAAVGLWVALAVPISAGAFSLTPHFWLNTFSTRDAVFNPSFIPTYLVWSSWALAMAGGAGMIWTINQRDDIWRAALIEWLGKWAAIASFICAASMMWWIFILFFEGLPVITLAGAIAVVAVCLGLILILWAARRPESFGKSPVAVVVVALLIQAGGIQSLRSTSPGPFVIQGHMFRNGILVSDIGKLAASGIWKPSPWRTDDSPPDKLALGAFSFRAQCFVCHSSWMGRGGIPSLSEVKYFGDVNRFLDELSTRHPALPVLAGSEGEKLALVHYIKSRLSESGAALIARPPEPPPVPVKVKKPLPPRPQASEVEKPAIETPSSEKSSEEEKPVSVEPPPASDVGKSAAPADAAKPETNETKTPVQGESPPAEAASDEIKKTPPPSTEIEPEASKEEAPTPADEGVAKPAEMPTTEEGKEPEKVGPAPAKKRNE